MKLSITNSGIVHLTRFFFLLRFVRYILASECECYVWTKFENNEIRCVRRSLQKYVRFRCIAGICEVFRSRYGGSSGGSLCLLTFMGPATCTKGKALFCPCELFCVQLCGSRMFSFILSYLLFRCHFELGHANTIWNHFSTTCEEYQFCARRKLDFIISMRRRALQNYATDKRLWLRMELDPRAFWKFYGNLAEASLTTSWNVPLIASQVWLNSLLLRTK